MTTGVEGPRSGISGGLLVTLAALAAVTPIAVDLYLPAFPQMVDELGADASVVQLTLMGLLLGLTLGQLVFGPLSDCYGRLRPLLVGTVVCVAASVLAALAPSVDVLIAARFVLGFGGAAGMVIGRAIISDLATGAGAARAFTLMGIVGGVAPVLAPFAGSLLVDPLGWRGILWVVCGLAVAILIAVIVVVRETHPPQRRQALRDEARGEGSQLRNLLSREFLGFALAFGFAFAVMMAYIAASPFVFQFIIGLTAVQYGIAFGVNSVGLITVSTIGARASSTRSPATLLGVGLFTQLAATTALMVLVVAGAPAMAFSVPIFFLVSSLGLIAGPATALALGAVPCTAGTGSAALGALQFAIGALVSPLVGLGGGHTALPMALVMVVCSGVAVGAYLLARPEARQTATAD